MFLVWQIGIKIYPNPAIDQVIIQTGDIVFEEYSMMNSEGKIALEELGPFAGNRTIL
ncbi:MAG: hypothetical protein H7329_03285 [Opitutaceae bacterium]|nr:hypothetical protein [Cytophagales bacterium]